MTAVIKDRQALRFVKIKPLSWV